SAPVACVAIGAVPHVAVDALVSRVRLGLRVTDGADEDRKVRRVGVAVATRGRATVRNPEPCVVERRTCPPRGRVAVLAGRSKPRGCVARIGRAGVGLLVAGDAERALAGVDAIAMALRARDGEVGTG